MSAFHPLVAEWFETTIGPPSPPQAAAWPLIAGQKNVLVAAPTGSGKTLTAFMPGLDRLFQRAVFGGLDDRVRILYVSPLKALGNDVQKNLLRPLASLADFVAQRGLRPATIRAMVRTGDTQASERQSMVRKPPQILITTPESLFMYLTSARARETLRGVETIIVDEIHALARDKRGSHLALSLERLKAICENPPQLIGLSATQRPLETIGGFLVGGSAPCEIVHIGHLRPLKISIETPEDELTAVATHEMWGQIYDRVEQLSREHRTMLIFANTRRLAERMAHDLGERLGVDKVAAHHGSMARELRLSAEERLKSGALSVMVATASLELGIDIGSVDLVCQIGTPRAIAVALQRVGRAGHQLHGISKGIVFAMTRDELLECAALLRAIGEGDLDRVVMPECPLDVLAQQITAACAADEWSEQALYDLCQRAYPFRDLTPAQFDQVVGMLSEGVSPRSRAGAHLHRDRVGGTLRARRHARITAIMNAGAIPDTFSYNVVALPEGKVVGTLDEDFAVESMAGDIFVLGSTSWRVRRVGQSTVEVEDAQGLPPTVPFWRGEAPSRTNELSAQVSRLREDLAARDDALASVTLAPDAADLLTRYMRTSVQMLGGVPSAGCFIAERFFDEAGGMQLIIHAPLGGRINRAWGLALRKRFCRNFDFELQAAATEDGILLSLGEQHSFELSDIFAFVSPNNVEEVLTQAILQIPLFGTRFRWNATRALALSRYSMGKRVPPQIQRARSDDLLAAVFPAQVGCQDNRGHGDIALPDHPLVVETMQNCLREAMDIDGLKRVLTGIKDGSIRTLAVDLPEPSPLAHQMLNSQPYTYLDDAPLEERRARAVSLRRTLPAEDAVAFGALDAQAIARVVTDAEPVIRDADELHEALMQQIYLVESEPKNITVQAAFAELVAARRAARFTAAGRAWAVPAERVPFVRALFGDVALEPALAPLPGETAVDADEALRAVVRGFCEICGPLTAREIGAARGLDEARVLQALHVLEGEGQVLRGRFRPESMLDLRASLEAPAPQPELSQMAAARAPILEWCDRRLLQRIHRLTVGRLRRDIEPLSPQDYMRFLFAWHHLAPGEQARGKIGLEKTIARLQGFEAPAAAWEAWLLQSRVQGDLEELLERACFGGDVAFGRLTLREGKPVARGARGQVPLTVLPLMLPPPAEKRAPGISRNALITFARRQDLDWLLTAARGAGATQPPQLTELSAAAHAVIDVLTRRGASFFFDIMQQSKRPAEHVEDALWELLGRGLITADAIDNLRVLQSTKLRKRQKAMRRGGPGRWSLFVAGEAAANAEVHERLARLFLQRYGIVWRDLVAREALAPSWRELLPIYRRLEARGEVRGGRFVLGFAGEQFALAEAVDRSRDVRRAAPSGQRVVISAVDPLNLTGVVTPGPRVPATMGAEVVYVDGVPQAAEGMSA